MSTQLGTLTAAYVGAVPFLAQRDIDPNLYDAANDKQFSDTMQLFGRMTEKKMWNFHNFINANTFQLLTVDTVTSGNGTSQVVIVLTAETSGYARLYDIIKFTDGKTGWVKITPTSTSTQQILTIKSVDGSNLTVTAGDNLVDGYNSVPESSDKVVSRIYGTTKFFNYIQAYREGHTETDIEKLTKVEITVEGQPYYGIYNFITKFNGLKTGISASMFDSHISTGSAFDNAGSALVDPVTGLPTQTHMGLDQWIENYGIKSNVQSLDTVTISDIDNLVAAMNASKAPLSFMGFTPTLAKSTYEDLLKNFTQATGLNSVRMNVDGKDVDMEVDKFNRGNHTFEFVPTSILDHPQLFTYPGAPKIGKSIYWAPKGMCAVVGGQGVEPYIGIGYKKQAVTGGYGDDIYSEWHSGALAAVPVGDVANWQVNWMSFQGLNVRNPKHLARQQVTS